MMIARICNNVVLVDVKKNVVLVRQKKVLLQSHKFLFDDISNTS
jgi:hypothetical protein